jgi:ubiquinone/menaquinone biosynthesis C-methylase UbiE
MFFQGGQDVAMGGRSANLRLWVEPELTALEDQPMPKPLSPNDVWASQKVRALCAREMMSLGACVPAMPEGVQPFTLQWFLHIEHQRHDRKAQWIPRLLEFSKHSGETLLGIGSGLGTDWVQYARQGANVVVSTSSADELAVMRRNFELRGLRGQFLHAATCSIPLPNASIDVVCLGDVLFETADVSAVIREVYRILKPGGKVLAMASAYYDVDYWYQLFFPWVRWFGWSRRKITANGFSARRLRRLFVGFVEPRIHKRHLRRSEVPHIWRFLPMSLLQRIFGRVLILKAFKPLSAASARPMAA